jgi:hypothetical protein
MAIKAGKRINLFALIFGVVAGGTVLLIKPLVFHIVDANIQTNQLGSSLAIGFSQVAQSKKVKEFFIRGKEISLKHINVFSDYLTQNSLPVPMSFIKRLQIQRRLHFQIS